MDNTRYAIINNGVVTNVTNVDGAIPDFLRLEGDIIPDFNIQASPSFLWDGTNFNDPTPPVELPADQNSPNVL